MKKLLLTTCLAAAISAAYGQGTIALNNGALSKISLAQTTDGTNVTAGTVAVMPTTANLEFGLFFGIGESTSLTLLTSQFGVNSSSAVGIIANSSDKISAMPTVGIPGTNPGETDVWMQVRAWSASFGTDWAAAQAAFNARQSGVFWGVSTLHNITGSGGTGLGATAGPGIPIWQGATGTSLTLLNAFTALNFVPEPGTFTLAGLGAAAMLIFRRRK